MNLKTKQKNKIEIKKKKSPEPPPENSQNKQKSKAPGVRKCLINAIEFRLDCARGPSNYPFLLLVLIMLSPPFNLN